MNTTILAIGNAGGNIAESIHRETKHTELKSTLYIFADCDEEDLKKHASGGKQTIHLTSGNDVFPENVFQNVRELIIIAGLGGKTGTKFTELAVKAAKDTGVDIIKVVTTIPFTFEGENHVNRAVMAAQRLSDIDGVSSIVFNNEELLIKYPDINIFNAFEAADNEIMRIIENLE